MDPTMVSDLLRDAVGVAIKLGAPMLLLSMLVGVVVAIFQAATQIHEQTLTFVPKVLVIALMLIVLGSWMMTMMSDLINHVFSLMVTL